MPNEWDAQLARIVGFGESSMRKSYYPELRRRLAELETANRALAGEIKRRQRAEETLRASEIKHRIVADNTYDWEFWQGPNGQFLYVSPACERITGHAAREFLADPGLLDRIIHPSDVVRFQSHHDMAMQPTAQPAVLEYRIIRADGTERWIGHVCRPMFDEGGQFLGVRGSNRDITERKRVQEELDKAQHRAVNNLECITDGFVTLDRDWRFTYLNTEAERILGLRREDLLGTIHWDELPFTVGGTIEEFFRRVAETRVAGELEYHHDPAGREGDRWFGRWIGFRAYPGDEGGLAIYFHDITERKRTEEERQAHIGFLESLDRINRAIQQAEDVGQMLWDVVRITFSIFGCDRAWLLHPCDPDAPTYRVPVEVTRPGYAGACELNLDVPMKPGADEVCRVLLATDGPVVFGPGGDYPLYHEVTEQFGVQAQMVMGIHPKTGQPWMFGMHQCSHPRVWAPQERRLFKEIARRIGDGLSSALMHRELRRSEERFRGLVEQAADAFFLVDSEGRILDVNQHACDDLGYSRDELLTMNINSVDVEVESQRHRERFWAALCPGKPATFEGLHRRRDGSTFPVEVRLGVLELGEERFMLGLARDITDRKRLERQLLMAQKMEAVGQLAGGVAHDFNNILTAILGNVDISLERLKTVWPTADATIDSLQQVERCAQRAAALTQQLLAFSRRQVVQPQVLNINDTLAEMERMLHRLLTENISLELAHERALALVRIDPGQFEQVVMNLVVNARDAMPEGGILMLETENATLDEEYVRLHPEARSGAYVILHVSDTGCGMDANTTARIFEPFFTTKGAGQGTGLGLATVYGIVRQAGGFVTVYSELGRGSTFKVYLPAVLEAAATRRAAETREAPPVGTETILLCEDDQAVRELVALVLGSAGYTVLPAENGARARRLAAEQRGPIHLLVTDVILPDTNGKTLADELQAIRPELSVIFASGYTANAIAHHGVLDDGIEFLEKPFTRRALLLRVRQVLDQAASKASATVSRNPR